MGQLTRADQERLNALQSVEQKLESLERESLQVCELNPDYCLRRLIKNFNRKPKVFYLRI